MDALIELDHRVTALEDLYTQQLHPKIESMNWAIGEVNGNTKAARADIRHVYSALDTMRASITSLEGTLERETSELRNSLSTIEPNVHSSIRSFREEVNQRFKNTEDRMDMRFEQLDAKLDEVLAAVRPQKTGE